MRRRETFSTNPFKNALIIYALQLKCTETLKVKTYDSATNSSNFCTFLIVVCKLAASKALETEMKI